MGDPNVKSVDIIPGEHQFVVNAPSSGYVIEMNNQSLITLARVAGAPHDPGAGILLHAKKGNLVKGRGTSFHNLCRKELEAAESD